MLNRALLAGTPNFRAVEGLPAVEGRRLRPGLLYRSEAVVDPDAGDRRNLTAAGIALVCDLRGADERERIPNAWWRTSGVEIAEHNILADIRGAGAVWDMLRHDPTVSGGHAIMLDIYAKLPEAAAPHLAAIVRRIVGGDLPILIHCTAGKDRTGFVIAALLRMVGVPMDAIVADYLLSASRISKSVAAATHALIQANIGFSVPEEACATLTGVNADYLRRSFAAIDTAWGSFEGYCDAAGLDHATRDRLADRLLTRAAK